jgi:multiple sugar transport system ATP-binding protein
MIAGLEEITSGELWIGDHLCNDVEPRDRGIAMVFQSYALYPHMTVRENVGFGLKLAGVRRAARDEKVREAARILQMEHLLDRKPSQLSGGQRQRVAIGRAIVRHPEVFLFDEPLSNLDAALRVDMRMELSRLHQELDATMIYVTHDQVEAMTLADKIVVLNAGEVQQVGTPMQLYQQPTNLFVAGFIGSPKMNFIDVEVQDRSSSHLTVTSQDVAPFAVEANTSGIQKGEKLTLGLRPHDLSEGQPGRVSGRVSLVERLGNETIVCLALPSGRTWLAALDADCDIQVGSRIGLEFSMAKSFLFDPEGRSLARVN